MQRSCANCIGLPNKQGCQHSKENIFFSDQVFFHSFQVHHFSFFKTLEIKKLFSSLYRQEFHNQFLYETIDKCEKNQQDQNICGGGDSQPIDLWPARITESQSSSVLNVRNKLANHKRCILTDQQKIWSNC